jgi:hypothetical protein
MKNTSFEKLIKDKVESHIVAAPDALDAILKRKSKAKGLAWFIGAYKWYLLTGGAAILIAGLWLANMNGDAANALDQKETAQNISVESSKTTDFNKTITESKTNTTAGNVPATKELNTIENKTTSKENRKSKAEVTPAAGEITESNTVKVEKSVDPDLAKILGSLKSRNKRSGAGYGYDKGKSAGKGGEGFDRSTGSPASGSAEKNTSNTKNSANEGDKKVDGVEKAKKEIQNTPKIAEMDQSPAAEKTMNDGPDLSGSAPALSKWSMSILYGPTYGFRNFDQTESNLAQIRNTAETPLYSHSLATMVSYNLTDNIAIYSGAHFVNRRVRNQWEHTETNFVERVEEREVKVIHPIEGVIWVTERETVTDTFTEQHTFNTANNYNSISIPLGVSYTLYSAKKWSTTVGADAAISYRWANGQVMESETLVLNLGQDNNMLRNFGTNFSINVGVGYRLNDRLHLTAMPRATFFTTSTFGGTYPLNQFDYHYGIMLGTKYTF